jgi:hypothetical protein
MIFDDNDFTMGRYERLCNAIASSRYTNMTFAEYFSRSPREDRVIILRHDVDESSRFARDMAKTEAGYGLRSTYYFRMKKGIFVPEDMECIASLGHEIGYHYETMDKCHGDVDKAAEMFRHELAEMRGSFDIRTVCMHGNPLTRYDNKGIWDKISLSDLGLLAEPYLSLDYSRFAYYSDSGRSWRPGENKVKDIIKQDAPVIRDSNELIRLIEKKKLSDLCILTHPERWNIAFTDYARRYTMDQAFIAGKKVIKAVRR